MHGPWGADADNSFKHGAYSNVTIHSFKSFNRAMWSHSTPVRLKTVQRTASLLLAALLMSCADVRGLAAERSTEIDKMMSTLYGRGQFNGAILVAEHGNIIYRKAFGKANFQTGADFTPDTPSNIGSVTKEFTGMAIMILGERNKLSYDDPVSKYIPEFSRSAHVSKISLRQLLTHTSGIPDYSDLGIDDSDLGQQGTDRSTLKRTIFFPSPARSIDTAILDMRCWRSLWRKSLRQVVWRFPRTRDFQTCRHG